MHKQPAKTIVASYSRQSYAAFGLLSLVFGFHRHFELCVKIAKILEERTNRAEKEMMHHSAFWENIQSARLFARKWCKDRLCRGISKVTRANLNGIVNNAQISCDATAKKEIKGCRFYSKRRGKYRSACECECIKTIVNMNTNIYLYIMTGWFIWSKKVISGSLQKQIQHSSKDSIWLFPSVCFLLLLVLCFTSCLVEMCVCKPAAGNVWIRAPVSWPAGCDWALCPAAGWLEGLMSGQTSDWTCGHHETPAWTGIHRERCRTYLNKEHQIQNIHFLKSLKSN